MRAVTVGANRALSISQLPLPPLSPTHSVLVKVSHSALNRADLLQRKGLYPEPKWAAEATQGVMGLECVGEIVHIADDSAALPWKVGDRVMGLLEGGGYAEFAACAPGNLMPIPRGLSELQAACLPEVWITAYQLLRKVANLQRGEHVLLHAGASSVSLAAANVALRCLGAGGVTAVTRTRSKFAAIERTDAQPALRDEFFADDHGDAAKFHVVLDPVGGAEFMPTLKRKTAPDGRIVVYAAMGGAKLPDFDLTPLFRNRISILSSTLRARSLDYKRSLITDFSEEVLTPLFEGKTSPDEETIAALTNLESVFSLEDVESAHEHMANNGGAGKIVLRM